MNEPERARILDGLYNHLLQAIHARYKHEGHWHAECPDCRLLRDKEIAARKAYELEIKAWVG